MEPSNLDAAFEKAVSGEKHGMVHLRLFVAGFTPRSRVAIQRLRELCEEFLSNHYQLEIIDIYQQPKLAREQQIIATPTLIRYQPNPKRVLIGDLSSKERVVNCLGLGV